MNLNELIKSAESCLDGTLQIYPLFPKGEPLPIPVTLMYVPKAEIGRSENAKKFWQVLYSISDNFRGYNLTPGAREETYEDALVAYNIPLSVLETQKICSVRDCDGMPALEDFCIAGQKISKKELRKKSLHLDAIKRLSRKRHENRNNFRKLPECQERIYECPDEPEERGSLTAVPRKRPERRHPQIRVDIVYSFEEERIYAEIKPCAETAPDEIDLRSMQLKSYDQIMSYFGESSPILYIMPTVPSLSELESYRNVAKETRRKIHPLVISSDYFLQKDVTARYKNVQLFLEKYSHEHGELTRARHSKEEDYLSKVLRRLKQLYSESLPKKEKSQQASLTKFSNIESKSEISQAKLPEDS